MEEFWVGFAVVRIEESNVEEMFKGGKSGDTPLVEFAFVFKKWEFRKGSSDTWCVVIVMDEGDDDIEVIDAFIIGSGVCFTVIDSVSGGVVSAFDEAVVE